MRPEVSPVPLCKPKVLLAGAEKAGSTTLTHWIAAHPDTLSLAENSFLVPQHARLRVLKFLKGAGSKGRGRQAPNPQQSYKWALNNVTEEQVDDPAVIPLSMPKGKQVMPMVLHEVTLPIKVGGKEVRYWVTHVHNVLDLLASPDEHIEWYYDAFPPVPDAAALEGVEGVPPEIAANAGKLTMDASPVYMDFEKWGSRRVFAKMPMARLVFVLRDPVETFYSHVKFYTSMQRKLSLEGSKASVAGTLRRCGRTLGKDVTSGNRGLQPSKFSDARARSSALQSCLDKGPSGKEQNAWGFLWEKVTYGLKLQSWVTLFPKSQVYMVCSEQMWGDPAAQMLRLARWLGLSDKSPEFWDEVTSYQYIPSPNSNQRNFVVDKVKVDRNTSTRKVPPAERRIAEFFYVDSNKVLKKLIEQDWTEFGWVYVHNDINDLLYEEGHVEGKRGEL